MMIWRPLVVMGVALGLLLGPITSLTDAKPGAGGKGQASQGKQKGKGSTKSGHHHHGVITHIDEKAGTFTIKTHHKKKSSTAAVAGGQGKGKGGKGKGGPGGQAGGNNKAGQKGGHHTFQVTPGTKVDGKLHELHKLHKGQHVSVKADKHVAHEVKTEHKGKKGAKKAGAKKKPGQK
jgi:hypothetical protein